jgi:protein TonB
MKHVLIILGVLFCANFLPAQDSVFYKNEVINRVDKNKLKQGKWKLYNDKANLVMECIFINDTIKGHIEIFKKDKLIIEIITPNNETKKMIVYYESDTTHCSLLKIGEKPTVKDSIGTELPKEMREWIFVNSSIMPMYYGGNKQLMQYIRSEEGTTNTKGNKGHVVIEFTIDKHGYVTDPGIKMPSHELLNKEAMRKVKSMPRWQPGFQLGGFVEVQYQLPFIF